MKNTLPVAFCNGLQNFPDSFLIHKSLGVSEVRTVSLFFWCLQFRHVSQELHSDVMLYIMTFITFNVYYDLLGVSLVHLADGEVS